MASSILLLLLASLVTSTAASSDQKYIYHRCSITGNFAANSTFSSNLNTLLSKISPTAGGYASATVGAVPERVYGIANCGGSIDKDRCNNCLPTAVTGLEKRCPFSRSGFICYNFCFLRYSNQNFIGSVDPSPVLSLRSAASVSAKDAPLFKQRLSELMGELMAALSTQQLSGKLSAMREVNFTPADPKIYGMVQCTRDLSPEDCGKCLQMNVHRLLDCCKQSRVGLLFAVSCLVRFNLPGPYGVVVPAPLETDEAALAPAPSSPPTTADNGNSKSTGKIVASVIPVALVLALSAGVSICFFRRKTSRPPCKFLQALSAGVSICFFRRITSKPPYKAHQRDSSIEPPLFNISTIRAATNNFSEGNKLGEGGFGPVYLGSLSNEQEIAVKRLSRNSAQGLGELKAEFMLLAKLQHRNLVKLLGICLEEEEKLLVYEFLPNKSLDTFLFDEVKRKALDWRRRYHIIEGIVRGLQYLHEESPLKIIHRDLKASNILLDADMNPKISDFGLARRFGINQSQARTINAAGTPGYMAPEYVMHGHFSRKSDVYSLGILVLEIVTGREKRSLIDSGQCMDLVSYVWEHWAKGTITSIVDPSLDGRFSNTEIMRCVQIGLLCIQDDPERRPSVSSIALMLQSFTITIEAPTRPTLFVMGNFHGQSTSMFEKLETVNEVSISEMEAR